MLFSCLLLCALLNLLVDCWLVTVAWVMNAVALRFSAACLGAYVCCLPSVAGLRLIVVGLWLIVTSCLVLRRDWLVRVILWFGIGLCAVLVLVACLFVRLVWYWCALIFGF